MGTGSRPADVLQRTAAASAVLSTASATAAAASTRTDDESTGLVTVGVTFFDATDYVTATVVRGKAGIGLGRKRHEGVASDADRNSTDAAANAEVDDSRA